MKTFKIKSKKFLKELKEHEEKMKKMGEERTILKIKMEEEKTLYWKKIREYVNKVYKTYLPMMINAMFDEKDIVYVSEKHDIELKKPKYNIKY